MVIVYEVNVLKRGLERLGAFEPSEARKWGHCGAKGIVLGSIKIFSFKVFTRRPK